MDNLLVFHLIASMSFMTFGVFVILRNRKVLHNQVFAGLMLLYFFNSVTCFVVDGGFTTLENAKAFIYQSVFIDMFIAPVLTLYVLIITKKYKVLSNKFFIFFISAIPVALIIGAFFIDDLIVFNSSFYGYYYMWNNLTVSLFLLMYTLVLGLVSFFLIVNYGRKSVDYRVRVISKTVAVAVFIVFSSKIFDQLQYLVFREEVVPEMSDLIGLVAMAFIFYGLMKRKILSFSSSVLSENILENLTSPVLLINEKGLIVYFNRASVEITSYRDQELKGAQIYKLLPGLTISIDEMRNFSEYGMKNIRTNLRDALGVETKVILAFRSLFDQMGQIQGIVCTMESLNKPATGQYDSRNKDERLLNAFAASDKGYWDWDIEKGELFFSEMACEILGYEPSELAVLTFSKYGDMLSPEYRNDYFTTLNNHLKRNTDSFYMEYRVKKKNGELLWILDKGRITATDSKNNPTRMSGVLTDITRVKKVEYQLRKTQKKLENTLKFKNKLVDFLSTNIREPFNSIIGFSEYLKYNPDISADERETIIARLHQDASRAFSTTTDLLEITRIDDGKVKVKMENVMLYDLLQEMETLFKDKLSEKQLLLSYKKSKDRSLRVDIDILKRILSIIMDNAIKFSYNNDKIEVSWERENGHFLLHIRDYGVGMTIREQRKVFKINETFINTGTLGENGFGLGLIIAERLARLIEGKISFSSSKNDGTEFLILLPAN